MWVKSCAPLPSEESLRNVQLANGWLVIAVVYWVMSSAHASLLSLHCELHVVRTMSKEEARCPPGYDPCQ
eukprot:7383430-Prorocentrum_lima.AAC.1